MATVVVVGTLDTKGDEIAYLADRLRLGGVDVLIVDCSVLGESGAVADIDNEQVAIAAGTTLAALREAGDRGAAVDAMGLGAGEVLRRLHEEGRLDGVIGIGGGGNTTLASIAMAVLPVGVPKLIVSTLVAGDCRPFVRGNDVTLMYSVVDIAGLNTISRQIIANAAAAIAGMAGAAPVESEHPDRPLIGATQFGVTTGAVDTARKRLEEQGFEVLVFHAVGAGGESLEALIRAGYLAGVLDITTTELADDLVGGVMSAGPDRLKAAAESGVPQVVSVGALDMVNLGPLELIPEAFKSRRLVQHNVTMTLMRTTPEECAELGRRIAERLNEASAPVTVFLPLGGVSAVATPGGPFHDADADAALFDAIRSNLRAPVSLQEIDVDINDPQFALAMADTLVSSINAIANA